MSNKEMLKGIFQVQEKYNLSDPEVCSLLANRVAFLLTGCVLGEDMKKIGREPKMPWISKEEYDKRGAAGQPLYGPLSEQEKK